MATLRERLLASLDRLIGWDYQCGDTKSEHTQEFYTDRGIKMVIVDNEGYVRVLGGSGWVIHQYDGKGNLLSRTPMYKTLKEGEHIIYGDVNAYRALCNQPR